MAYTKVTPILKRNLEMDINQYIDIMLIDPYATKHLVRGYSLWLDEINDGDIQNFLDYLHEKDEKFRDIVENYMQELINKRLSLRESTDRRMAGLEVVRHSNGDYSIERRYAT